MEESKRIIEVNGIKMEIDLRNAKRLDTFRVGDKVRVLVKHYDTYASHAGIIVGFDNFVARPTIVVAYVQPGRYSGDALQFAYINADSKDVEITAMVDDFVAVDKNLIIDSMNREIEERETQIQTIKAKKEYFLKYFGAYFGDAGA